MSFARFLMKRFDFLTKGASTLEYATMIVVLIAVMLIMQKYVWQAISGRWRAAGDSFGFGRQYLPSRTKEYAVFMVSPDPSKDFWYDTNCAEKAGCLPGNQTCFQGCLSTVTLP